MSNREAEDFRFIDFFCVDGVLMGVGGQTSGVLKAWTMSVGVHGDISPVER